MKLYIPKPLITGSNTKTNYYAFGMAIQGRQFSGSSSYRYGFNGKENDKETVGTGEGTQDYGMRIYNPSLGKFLSVDPLTSEYAELTPYQFASNTPIVAIDRDGEELDLYESNLETIHALDHGYMEELTERRYREGMGVATLIIGAVDVFFTKGWLGRTLGVYQVGEMIGNGEKAAEARKIGDFAAAEVYENRSKEAALSAALIFGPGLIGKTGGAIIKSARASLKAVDMDGLAVVSDANGKVAGSAFLQGGELSLTIRTAGTELKGRGSDVFKSLYSFVNKNYDKITSIRGIWREGEMGANMKQFNDYISKGFTEIEAAAKTFTGTNATKLGFKNIKIENVVKNADGKYTSVEAVFSK